MEEFQYILCYGSSKANKEAIQKEISFQYILCYGSSNSRDRG